MQILLIAKRMPNVNRDDRKKYLTEIERLKTEINTLRVIEQPKTVGEYYQMMQNNLNT